MVELREKLYYKYPSSKIVSVMGVSVQYNQGRIYWVYVPDSASPLVRLHDNSLGGLNSKIQREANAHKVVLPPNFGKMLMTGFEGVQIKDRYVNFRVIFPTDDGKSANKNFVFPFDPTRVEQFTLAVNSAMSARRNMRLITQYARSLEKAQSVPILTE